MSDYENFTAKDYEDYIDLLRKMFGDDISKLDQRIADLERHNELLRAATLDLWESYNLLFNFVEKQESRVLLAIVVNFFISASGKLQAAIDGGALEVE